jgi:proline iminopeptidase
MGRRLGAAGLALAGLLATTACAQHRTDGHIVRHSEGYVETDDGVRLFYKTAGDGDEMVFVLHGGPGFTHDYLADDFTPLAEDYTLVFYDQRGTGRSTLVSTPEGLDAERFAHDLEALRQHFGLDALNLLGHSWGAGVAALYALQYRQRVERIVLVGAMPLRRAQLVRSFEQLAADRGRDSRAALLARLDAWLASPGDAAACRSYYESWFQPFFGDPAAQARSRGDFCAGTPASLQNKVASVDRYTLSSLEDWDWRASLREVEAPALVVHGSLDVISVQSAREWTDALPNAEFLLLEGVGHFPYLEAPESFFAPVRKFLGGASPARANPHP